jgi:hypothetical protein
MRNACCCRYSLFTMVSANNQPNQHIYGRFDNVCASLASGADLLEIWGSSCGDPIGGGLGEGGGRPFLGGREPPYAHLVPAATSDADAGDADATGREDA